MYYDLHHTELCFVESDFDKNSVIIFRQWLCVVLPDPMLTPLIDACIYDIIIYIYILYIYIYASLCLYIKVCNKPPTWYRNGWAVKLTSIHAQSLFTIKCKWMRHLISLLPNQFSSNVEGGKIKVIHHSDVGIMGLTHSVRHVVIKMLEMHLISFLDIAMKQVGEICSKMINTWEDTTQYIFIDILICWH